MINMFEKRSFVFRKNVDYLLKKKLLSLCKIKHINKGIAVLEATLTLPIIIIIIFFILEMMNVNNTRTAIDSIALEATLEFISSKNTEKFEEIIKKYKPVHVPRERIKYYFAVYESIDSMCSISPYGNEEIYWPTGLAHEFSTEAFVDSDRDGRFLGRSANSLGLTNQEKPELSFGYGKGGINESLTNKAFVLTVVCDYKFSSDFIRKFFAGGANTKNGEHFLIWGRGVGICN